MVTRGSQTVSSFDSANQSKVKAYLYAMFESLDSQAHRPVMDKIRNVLYLDVDGVLQYADGGCWRPRLEAEDFLAWAVQHFDCRWLTAWARPNASLPSKLGIKVPPGIVEMKWQSARVKHPFKAAARSLCPDLDGESVMEFLISNRLEDEVWLKASSTAMDRIIKHSSSGIACGPVAHTICFGS